MKVNAAKDVIEVLKKSLSDSGKDAVRFEIAGFG